MTVQFTDPTVSETKFLREIEEYRALEPDYRRRGWILVSARFPKVLVLLAAPQLKPPPIVTGVAFDYTNYDARPPSVRFVDPFTSEPYSGGALPTNLPRAVEMPGFPAGLQLPPGAVARMVNHQPLLQAYGADDPAPFLCIAGVREYHDHPGHSGDAWELHRPSGAGRLVRILEVITTYGVAPLTDYRVTLVPQVTGLLQAEVPA